MKVAMIGSGYVGLVSGTCFAEFGLNVVCVDKDPAKISALDRGEIPIFEPGLETLVRQNVAAGRLRFTTDLKTAVDGVDAVFIGVGTPSRRGDGHADLTYVFAAVRETVAALSGPAVIVTKSTVPVGTGRHVKRIAGEVRPDLAIEVASNPEFLREGSAIEDFMRPDRVVCGVDSAKAQEVLQACYQALNAIEAPVIFTSLETAELIKYAANSFLATKITFINEIADLCERVGADVMEVARGIGLDDRIGKKFLQAGPGYGGSCFPKDTLALLRTAEQVGVPQRIVESVVSVNEGRKRRMVYKIIGACGGAVAGKTIAVLGVTFKPDTDDMRDSPSLVIIPALQAEGATIRVYDPEGRPQAEPMLPDVTWCSDTYDTLEGADAAVLMTEWNEFRTLDFDRMHQQMNGSVIVDLRNVYNPADLTRAGFAYTGVGRPNGALET